MAAALEVRLGAEEVSVEIDGKRVSAYGVSVHQTFVPNISMEIHATIVGGPKIKDNDDVRVRLLTDEWINDYKTEAVVNTLWSHSRSRKYVFVVVAPPVTTKRYVPLAGDATDG